MLKIWNMVKNLFLQILNLKWFIERQAEKTYYKMKYKLLWLQLLLFLAL